MAKKDLTIRILGRPQVSKDDAVGYQRISRQYVVEGYRASYAGINDEDNPLFIAVGTEDEEFEGHYLINQKITPKQGSIDTAYLTREFVEIRDTWSSESFSQSRGFKKITRQFVALRAEHALGYSAENFQYHPTVSPQKEDDPHKYLPLVVENNTPTTAEGFSFPVGVNFNHIWHANTIAVDIKSPGIDVWSVSWIAPIRPEGEPIITKDSQAGYQTVKRSYAISGDFYNKNSIFDSNNPLFLSVGTADHEYSDHYLVNQDIKPMVNMQKEGTGDDIEDLAILSREFVELRGTHVQESVSASNDLRRIRRTYVVLRGVSPSGTGVGYSQANFLKHPDNSSQNVDPWQYPPEAVVPPGAVQLSNPTTNSLGAKTPSLGEGTAVNPPASLYSVLNHADYNQVVNYAAWMKGSVQVSRSSPGLDVWSVEWVTHGNPYWTTGTQRGGNRSMPLPKVVEFDYLGLRIADFGAAGTASSTSQVATYVFYVTDEIVPSSLSKYWGGGNVMTPSVMFDCKIIHADSVNSTAFSKHSTISNAVFKGTTETGLQFPTYKAWKDSGDGNKGGLNTSVQTMSQEGKLRVFLGDLAEIAGAYDDIAEQTIYVKAKGQVTIPAHKKLNYDKLPCFKGLPVRFASGTLSYSQGYNGTYNFATPVSVKVNPIFTSSDTTEKKKIWQVAITYVG